MSLSGKIPLVVTVSADGDAELSQPLMCFKPPGPSYAFLVYLRLLNKNESSHKRRALKRLWKELDAP